MSPGGPGGPGGWTDVLQWSTCSANKISLLNRLFHASRWQGQMTELWAVTARHRCVLKRARHVRVPHPFRCVLSSVSRPIKGLVVVTPDV